MVGWLAFGTGEGLLWYGICVPCSKRPPGVRNAFSEACRAKSSLLPHRTHLQCAKQPRSEVSRHKKRVTSKSIKTFWSFRDSVGIQAYIDRVKGLADVKILEGERWLERA